MVQLQKHNMPPNTTLVAMDAEKLFRCQLFFTKHMLRDRRCTFDVFEYQTSLEKFTEFYNAVSKDRTTSFSDHFQITGTIPVRAAVRKFAEHMALPATAKLDSPDNTVPQTHTSIQQHMPIASRAPAKASVPQVPQKSWPVSVLRAHQTQQVQQAQHVQHVQQAQQAQQTQRGPARKKRRGPQSSAPVTATGSLACSTNDTAMPCKTSCVTGPAASPDVKFLVHFLCSVSDMSFGKTAASALVNSMRAKGCMWLFLVTVSGITTYATRELQAFCPFEAWPMRMCLMPAVTHYTFPAHRLLAPREKKEFYAKWKVSQAQMPRMQVSDPVARYYGFVPGDVVEIQRRTFAGTVPAYRVVVHAAV